MKMKSKAKSKSAISIEAAPKGKIYVKSINGRAMQIDFQKQQPQLRELPNQSLNIENHITDAD